MTTNGGPAFFSIVRVVDRGAVTSYPSGVVEVGFDLDAQRAREDCRRWNECCRTHGVRYEVEELESDESPDRKPTERMLAERTRRENEKGGGNG